MKLLTSQLLVIFLAVTLPTLSHAENLTYFGGIYADNMNDWNGKLGIGYLFSSHSYKEAKELKAGLTGDSLTTYAYMDAEVGERGNKLTIGYGESVCCVGNLRGGLSYANLDDTKYLGLEMIISPLFLSLKTGIYKNLSDDDYHYLIGIGAGW